MRRSNATFKLVLRSVDGDVGIGKPYGQAPRNFFEGVFMQVLNALQVALVAGGGKSTDPSTGSTPPPVLAPRPRPWPWIPVEP